MMLYVHYSISYNNCDITLKNCTGDTAYREKNGDIKLLKSILKYTSIRNITYCEGTVDIFDICYITNVILIVIYRIIMELYH